MSATTASPGRSAMFRILNISHDIGLTDRLSLALQGSASVIRVDPAIDTLR